MGLILHCGAKPVEYEQLKDLPVTPKDYTWTNVKTGKEHSLKRSDRWQGVQHYDFASIIVASCEAFGLPVNMDETQWGVSDEGSDLFALIKFLQKFPDGTQTIIGEHTRDNLVPNMGVRHSNRGRMSQQITVGADVTVCDNMVITGTYMLRKKHTTGNANHLAALIQDGLVEYIKSLPALHTTVAKLKDTGMSDTGAARFCQKLGRDKLLPWSHIGHVDKLWQHPTHSEFRDQNQWRMYNAVNTVVKRYNPNRQFEVVGKLNEVFDNFKYGTTLDIGEESYVSHN